MHNNNEQQSSFSFFYKSLIQPHFDHCSIVWNNLERIWEPNFKIYKTEPHKICSKDALMQQIKVFNV